VPVRERRPEDDRPLFRAVNEQRLMGPVGVGREGQGETQSTGGSRSSTQATEAPQAGKGPIATAIDKAEQNNWVYPSMAQMARERGLLDKADEVLSKVKAQLGGG